MLEGVWNANPSELLKCFKSSPTLQPSYSTWKVRFELLWIRPETSSTNLRLSQYPGILLCQCFGIFLSSLFEWALASAAFASILCCGGWTPQWHCYWLEGPSIAGLVYHFFTQFPTCSCQRVSTCHIYSRKLLGQEVWHLLPTGRENEIIPQG